MRVFPSQAEGCVASGAEEAPDLTRAMVMIQMNLLGWERVQRPETHGTRGLFATQSLIFGERDSVVSEGAVISPALPVLGVPVSRVDLDAGLAPTRQSIPPTGVFVEIA